MFRGITNLNLDSKGRMAIPARYRDELRVDYAGQLVITRDIDEPCLTVYPIDTWREIEAQIDALTGSGPAVKRLRRILIGYASEVTMDASGRVNLSAELREYASLSKEVVLVGQGKKFELWDEQAWRVLDEGAEGGVDMDDALASLSL